MLAYFLRPHFFFGGRGLASLAISARAFSTSPRVGTGIAYPLAVFWVLVGVLGMAKAYRSRESWWLKLERAEENFRDLTDEILRYTNTNPYEAVRAPPPDEQPDIWLYRLRITEQPDARVALIAGDLAHNIRTIFDHLAVAVTGHRDASFPVCYKDPWETLSDGSLRPEREKARASFESKLDGASTDAVALVKALQPYSAGDDWANHPLGIISKLDNADKHRNMIPTTVGVSDGVSYVARRSGVEFIFYWPFCNDGAEVAKFAWAGPDIPPETEVKVHVRGTPRVAVEISDREGYAELTQAFRHALDEMPPVIEALQAFARG